MSIVFGPVPSRRLGYSLGIDLLPPDHKLCTLDCIYCQVGCTYAKSLKRGLPVPTAEVNRAIDENLPKNGIDVVSFSGSGEPTLHRDLGQFIDRVKNRCRTPVVVITNATLIDRPDVRHDLAKADIVVPSLDAATQTMFEKLDRPHAGLRVDRIIDGLEEFRREYPGKIFLEIMLVKGYNDDPAELMALRRAMDRLRPDKIHLNTVVRPPAEEYAQALSPAELERIAQMFGPAASVAGPPPTANRSPDDDDLETRVLEMIRRRSVTLEDITKSLGLHKIVATKIVEKLIAEKNIKRVVHGGVIYFREFY
ncbi:MAG: radical SAM protein [Myxococcales bacterium]|nr:radical SAM protein [Myxococcales bacterium]